MPGEISVIGKQEDLVNDLVRFLKLAGEIFDEGKLKAVKSQNVGGSKTSTTFKGYLFALSRDIVEYEQRALERYKYRH